MKKAFLLLLTAVLLVGCKPTNPEMERMMSFRASLLAGIGCHFQAEITADYQDELYQFTLECRSDEQGTLNFTVLEPESISGIRGTISGEGGKITFNDDHALAFDTMADGQIAPITAPWLLIKTLRSGYVTACGTEEDMMRVTIDDSYEDDALSLDIWFSSNIIPKHAEILWNDRRILSLEVANFEIL